MKIRLRAFAVYRELLGQSEKEVEVAIGATVKNVFDLLFGQHPEAEKMERSTLFAVNRQYVKATTELNEGDELSLLPPVAGG